MSGYMLIVVSIVRIGVVEPLCRANVFVNNVWWVIDVDIV